MNMVLAWKEDGTRVPIGSVDALDRELDRVAEESPEPVMVALFDGDDVNSPTLLVGVGAPMAVLSWSDPSGRTPNLLSRGSDSEEEPVTEFVHAGESSEVPAFSLIPHDRAREAARTFIRTKSRPGGVDWEAI